MKSPDFIQCLGGTATMDFERTHEGTRAILSISVQGLENRNTYRIKTAWGSSPHDAVMQLCQIADGIHSVCGEFLRKDAMLHDGMGVGE